MSTALERTNAASLSAFVSNTVWTRGNASRCRPAAEGPLELPAWLLTEGYPMFLRSIALRTPRCSALSVSLAAGLGLALSTSTDALADAITQGPHPATPHTVTTCADDDSPGSLRAIIASPNTGDGDTIDLTQLACSTITLDDSIHTPSHITVAQPTLHLLGPGSGALTIDGGFHSSVLRHVGYGTLDVQGITVANGKYVSGNEPFGGCIYSRGNVTLTSARIDSCSVVGIGASNAAGGGIFAAFDVTLDSSVITNAAAHGDGASTNAYGGGVFAGGDLQVTYSMIGRNLASADFVGLGGAVAAFGGTIGITSSTIYSNQADAAGGVYLPNHGGTSQITDSTISGNEAVRFGNGALYAYGNLKIFNSTIAFNHDQLSPSRAGVTAGGASLILESSIVAGNSGPNGAADLWVDPATTTMTASNNLVIAATGVSMPPADCPQLDLLADNGGPALTHAIRHTSPAIDAGSNSQNLLFDQTGSLRVGGAAADIGAVEWRNDITYERVFVAGFDGLCDQ
jgi:hypothetical protein